MTDNENASQARFGRVLMSWQVPEFFKYEKSKKWYLISALVTLSLLIFSLIEGNFIFTIFIVLTAIVILMYDMRQPNMLNFTITSEGLEIGNKYIDYDDLKEFSIIYKPHYGAKKIYFEFKNRAKMRLMIPLDDQNPLVVRELLLKYLPENTERTDETLGDFISRWMRL